MLRARSLVHPADQRDHRLRRDQGGHRTTTTPRLPLPYILTQQTHEGTHAAALDQLDVLVQPVVRQIGLNAPPGSPAEGACWIIALALTGTWDGRANRLAQWGWTSSARALVAQRLLHASIISDPPSLAACGPRKARRSGRPHQRDAADTRGEGMKTKARPASTNTMHTDLCIKDVHAAGKAIERQLASRP